MTQILSIALLSVSAGLLAGFFVWYGWCAADNIKDWRAARERRRQEREDNLRDSEFVAGRGRQV
jgi:hypothetical protein